jgi:prepilin-type N-terminal cleavage/methylation domain-containing protein
MNSRISSRRSQITANSPGGFSLIELLVTLFIAGIMLSTTASFFSMSVATRQNMGMVTEAQQGLRALLGIVTQELRQAGACLPSTGLFIALNGVNSGTQDSLTVRIGQVDRDTLACVQGSLSAAAAMGATTVTLTAGQGSLFADTTLMYITDGANGEFHSLTATTANSLTFAGGLTRNYAVASGVYGVEERVYAIDASGSRPVLTVAIDGGSAWPLVDGVQKFDVQYLLGPCAPTCASTVNLPASAAQWSQVREVFIDAQVISPQKQKDGQYAYDSGQVTVKPRNLTD